MLSNKKIATVLLISSLVLSSACSKKKETLSWKQAQVAAENLPHHTYPYTKWINALEKKKVKAILIFIYGSLMDPYSASITLNPKALKSMKPALAFGYVRAFDRDVPIRGDSKWQLPEDPLARGMLNLKPADPTYFVTGMLIHATIEDLRSLLRREEGYDLIPIVVANWEELQAGKKSYQVAYTFHAPQGSPFTSRKVTPRPHYYELARDASWNKGPLFGHLWFQTTYLADGQPIGAWERQSHK